jgi:hypothetical protein
MAGGLGLLDLSSCAFTEADMNKAVLNRASETILFIAKYLYRKVKYWPSEMQINFKPNTCKD